MTAPRLVVGIAVILCLFGRGAMAAPTSTSPLEDSAMVIAEGDEAVIENDLRALASGGVDMAVIVMRSLGGSSIESVANFAAVEWTSGKAETQPSAVLVIAIQDRKSRIEVNDAFRGNFPDSRAQVILDNVRGFLRSSDYAGAVRAVITDVGKAARGEAPDLESPNPQSNLPASSPVSTTTTTTGSSYRGKSDNTVMYLVIGGIAFIFGMGALWAAAARKSNFTLSHDGSVKTLQRSFFIDWMWHSAKLVGWLGFIIFIIAAASGSSSSNTSSSWGGSSSSGGSSNSGFGGGSSSGGGGGGWSGGGASSSW